MKKLIIFIAIISCNVSFTQTKLQTISQNKRDSIEIAFVKELNKYRKQNGLEELIINRACSDIALEQASYCASINILTHKRPLGKDNLGNHGEAGSSSSGQLSSNITDISKHLLNRWKNSPRHNQILLLNTPRIDNYSKFEGVGLSFEVSESGIIYYFLFISF